MSLKLTWYRHASFRIDVADHVLLVDAFFSDNPAAAVTADQVATDFILISHGHGDHTSDAAAIATRTRAKIISNFEIATW